MSSLTYGATFLQDNDFVGIHNGSNPLSHDQCGYPAGFFF